MTTGIYKVTNKINGNSYVGLSKNIEKRWKVHRTRFTKNDDKEYDKAFYRALRKYGIENFSWEILEECDEKVLTQREIYYIKKFDTYKNGYNETLGGDIGGFEREGELHPNHKLTEEDVINIRIRYNQRERRKKVYEDYQDRIGQSGFNKIWKGETWKHIMMEVYTPENINFHKHNSGNPGSENGRSKLKEKDVYNIRLRRKNGERLDDVYQDYKHLLTKGSFNNVWSYRNWKNIIV